MIIPREINISLFLKNQGHYSIIPRQKGHCSIIPHQEFFVILIRLHPPIPYIIGCSWCYFHIDLTMTLFTLFQHFNFIGHLADFAVQMGETLLYSKFIFLACCFILRDLNSSKYYKFSFYIFLISINCVPKLVWDFPRLCGLDTLIKFIYLSHLSI